MKAGTFVTFVTLLALSAAQPHRHQHPHKKHRDLITQVDVVTVTAPPVFIEVYESDTITFTEGPKTLPPAETATSSLPPPPPTSSSTFTPSISLPPTVIPTPTSTSSSSSTSTFSPTTQAPPLPPVSTLVPTSSVSNPPVVPAPTSPAISPGNGFGISYNPYNDDGTCKDRKSVHRDIDCLKDYSMIRIYGLDCNQLDTVLPAIESHDGMKVFIGIHETDHAASQAQRIVHAVDKYFDGDWSRVDTVSVGNEAVQSGAASAGDIVAAIRAARSVLRNGGFQGPVVTVDTMDTFLNPDGSGIQLCKESSYNAANIHPFFDTSGYYNNGSRAGDFVTMQVARFKKACGDRRTVVTETGWPHSSSYPFDAFTNRPVPDEANHVAAISSLKETFAGTKYELVLFSAFNTPWKKDSSGTFGTEKFWGIFSSDCEAGSVA